MISIFILWNANLSHSQKKYAFVFSKRNIQFERSADVEQKFNDTLSILANDHYLSSGYLWLLM